LIDAKARFFAPAPLGGSAEPVSQVKKFGFELRV